jgi:hypothetical protein
VRILGLAFSFALAGAAIAACSAFGASSDETTPQTTPGDAGKSNEAAVPQPLDDGGSLGGSDAGCTNPKSLIDDSLTGVSSAWTVATKPSDVPEDKITPSMTPFNDAGAHAPALVTRFVTKTSGAPDSGKSFANLYIEQIFHNAAFTTATLDYEVGYATVSGYAEFGCELMYRNSAGLIVDSELRQNNAPPTSAPVVYPIVAENQNGHGFLEAFSGESGPRNAALSTLDAFHHITSTLTLVGPGKARFGFAVDDGPVGTVDYDIQDTFDALSVRCGVIYIAPDQNNPSRTMDLSIRNVSLVTCP